MLELAELGVEIATPRTRTAVYIRKRTLPLMQINANRLTKTVLLKNGERLTILEEITLNIEHGEIFGIVGISGSGKSTLLGLLAGLDLPSSGSIFWETTEINQLNEDQRALMRLKGAGFVFQNFELLEAYTALENVMLPLELAGKLNAKQRALECLAEVGLRDRMNHYPQQLSGGEQQRVALARAFATQPKILFLDEPTGSLDQKTGNRVVDILLALNQAHKTTLICVTHDPNLNRLFSRTVHLAGGKVKI